jgi:hypothetical protein
MQTLRPQLLCFPYLRKNRGVYPANNVGAPTFSLSFLPIPTLGSLPFQSFAHSFIFRITRICCIFRSMRTLEQEHGVPLLVHTSSTRPRCLEAPPHWPRFAGPWPLFLHSPPIHNPVTAPSPIFLPLLSQCSPVRGSTHTPCLPSTRGLRYTSTDAIRSARSAHETRTDY